MDAKEKARLRSGSVEDATWVGGHVEGGATVMGETRALNNACCLATSEIICGYLKGRIVLVPIEVWMLMTELGGCRLLTGQPIKETYLRKRVA